MIPGFERYTYRTADGGTRTIDNIPTAEINKLRREHGLTHSEAILAWDSGQIPVASEKQTKQTRKSTRQPDLVKQNLISFLVDALTQDGTAENVEATNAERVIAFTIGNDKYELTLSKKRAAK